MDGFGDIELVHGGQDDGGGGQKKQPQEESEVDAQPLEPPAEALGGEVLPAEGGHGLEDYLPVCCLLYQHVDTRALAEMGQKVKASKARD